MLVAETVQVYIEKKYCGFINLFVLYVSVVVRAGLAETGFREGEGGQEQSQCAVDRTWKTGILRRMCG